MAIRVCVKTLIERQGRYLIQKYEYPNEIFYELPGGKVEQNELLEEAVRRELTEETGFELLESRLVGMCEDIFTGEEFRRRYPEHAHKLVFLFTCRVGERRMPTAVDVGQTEEVWLTPQEIAGLNIRPRILREPKVWAQLRTAEHVLVFPSIRTE